MILLSLITGLLNLIAGSKYSILNPLMLCILQDTKLQVISPMACDCKSICACPLKLCSYGHHYTFESEQMRSSYNHVKHAFKIINLWYDLLLFINSLLAFLCAGVHFINSYIEEFTILILNIHTYLKAYFIFLPV